MLEIVILPVDELNAFFGEAVVFFLHMEKLVEVFLLQPRAAFTQLVVKGKQKPDAAEIRKRMNGKNVRINTAAERRIRKGQAQIAEEKENKSQKQRNNQFP